jgi:hypothetical protein
MRVSATAFALVAQPVACSEESANKYSLFPLREYRPFRYCMNFGAKQAELLQLVHKFVQRSRVRIFRIERTRSTLLHTN